MFEIQPAEPDPAALQPPAPDYLVGRDGEGHWLAVETHGLGGGLFRSEAAAIRFAAFETGRRPGAVQRALEPLILRL
jgi:hypothetical protein